MRFCIYGAGAIGGYVAVELASAGHDVARSHAVRIFAPSASAD